LGVASLVTLLAILGLPPLAVAQHEMHGMSTPSDLEVLTMPANDEVLAAAPSSVMLHFQSEVTLVKLVVKNAAGDFVDVGFRYQPSAGMHYMQAVPALQPADYYVVEWAVLDSDDKLVKGNFYFSFGADARPASYYLEQMEHPQHIMSPDYRLL